MQPSKFTVVTAATDLKLLTITELRRAAEVSDDSRDPDLLALGVRVAEALTGACRIATDGAVPPTLRLETLEDTFRLNKHSGRRQQQVDLEVIHLSRRPIVSISSVVEAGVTLDPSSYEVMAGSGALTRLFNDCPYKWALGKIVVSYTAGWAVVPQNLKLAASKLVGSIWSSPIDPNERRINLPGVIEKERWVGPKDEPLISAEIIELLGPYRNVLT